MDTEAKIRQIIENARAEDLRNVRAFQAVRGVLSSMEGKKVTKRVLPALKAALIGAGVATEDSTFSYLRPYTFSCLEIAVWGKGAAFERFDDRLYFVLTRGSGFQTAGDDCANLEWFDQSNGAKGAAAVERNRKRVKCSQVRIGQLAAIIDQINASKRALEMALDSDGPFEPDKYTLEKLTGSES